MLEKLNSLLVLWFFILSVFGCSKSPDEQLNEDVVIGEPKGQFLIPYRRQELWGYADTTGKLVIEPKFSEAWPFTNGVAWVKNQKHLWGLIDSKGREVLKPSFITVYPFRNGFAEVEYGNEKGLVDLKGKLIVPLDEHSISPLVVASGADNPPEFFEVHFIKYYGPKFLRELGIKILRDGRGLFNSKGRRLLPTKYDHIYYLGEGITLAMKDTLYHCLDRDGRLIKNLSKANMIVGVFRNGLAAAGSGQRWGFVDKDLKPVIPLQYEMVRNFNSGVAPARKNGIWGYINNRNETVIPFEFEEAAAFIGGAAIIKKNGYYGIISRKGNPYTTFNYRSIQYVEHSGLYKLERKDKVYQTGWFNSKLNRFILPTGHSVSNFSEGLAKAEDLKNYKTGFLDSAGNQAIPFQYEKATDFRHGLAVVSEGFKNGLINRYNKLVVPFGNYEVYSVAPDLAFLTKPDPKGNGKPVKSLLDLKTGRQNPVTYQNFHTLESGHIAAFNGTSWTVLDDAFLPVIPYDKLPPGYSVKDVLNDRIYRLNHNSEQKEGYMHRNGKLFFED